MRSENPPRRKWEVETAGSAGKIFSVADATEHVSRINETGFRPAHAH